MQGSDAKGNRSPFFPDVLDGRVCLVTGGGSGIGYEIATQLGHHGARVALMGRRKEFLEEAAHALTQQGIETMAVQGDVRSRVDAARVISEVVQRFGKLDTLVNSAAGNFLAAAEQLRPKGFKTVMDIDALGVFTMTRAAFEELKRSEQGVVINISATLHYGATWYQIHASAAKAAIDSVTRSLALEWGRYNIRVNGIAPGPIADTAGLTKLAPGDPSSMEDMVKTTIPLNRLGTKSDIAYTAVFLCTDAASFITGDTLVVDGAAWLWRQPPIPLEMVLDISRQVESKSRSVGGAQSKL